jgi:hypothetical protein
LSMLAANLHTLIPHPATPPKQVEAVGVEVARHGDTLRLEYSVYPASAVRLPVAPSTRTAEGRADGLWQATCLELFVRPSGGEGYLEFNFSPSLQWAAYAFDGYREGMRDLPAQDPALRASAVDDRYCLAVEDLPVLPAGPLRIALTAVIEELDGTKSYWSLAHPAGKPDFHAPENFALTL